MEWGVGGQVQGVELMGLVNTSSLVCHSPYGMASGGQEGHKSIKARRYRGLWLFTASFVLDKQLHLCCLLKYEGKKKYQSKVPSINKLCFLFPLSPFSPMLYLLVFEFSIVIVNHVKGLGPFIDLWSDCAIPQ